MISKVLPGNDYRFRATLPTNDFRIFIRPANVGEQGVALALALTENFLEEIGEGACRVHGGGFAGTIQVFIPK